jgi:hypothetical protein
MTKRLSICLDILAQVVRNATLSTCISMRALMQFGASHHIEIGSTKLWLK